MSHVWRLLKIFAGAKRPYVRIAVQGVHRALNMKIVIIAMLAMCPFLPR